MLAKLMSLFLLGLIRALTGARLVTNEPHAFPGPQASVYVVMKVKAQRNIYRVPVQ